MKRKRSLWLFALVPVVALIWAMRSAASWRPQLLGVQKGAQGCLMSPDGKLLLVHDGNGKGQIWHVDQNQPLWANKGSAAKFSPDSRWMCVVEAGANEWKGFFNVPFSLREARTGRLMRVFLDSRPRPQSKDEDFQDAAFSSDGRHLKILTTQRLMRWDTATGRLLKTIEVELLSAEFSPNEEIFSVGTGEGGVNIKISDARTGRHLRSIEADIDADNHFPFAFSPDGSLVEVVGLEAINIYHLKAKKWLLRFDEEKYMKSVFSPDGKLFYHPTSKGLDIHDANTGRKLNTLFGPKQAGFVASPDGNWLYEARDGKIYRWRAR